MVIDYDKLPTFPDYVCLVTRGYTGTAVSTNIYLGIDRVLDVNSTVSLTGIFLDKSKVKDFFLWWENDTKKAYDAFKITTTLFGEEREYVLRFNTDIKHTISNGVNTIQFEATVLVSRLIANNPPVALHQTVVVEKNSVDNYIIIDGFDPDGDNIAYEIQVPPANGKLRGDGKTYVYTPTPDFSGEDCFSFVVTDKYLKSQPVSVDIIVAEVAIADSIIEYRLLRDVSRLYIYGDLHYKNKLGHWKKIYNAWIDLSDCPEDGTYRIVEVASYDAVVDDRSASKVTDITIKKWGKRQNIDRLFAFFDHLNTLSVDLGAGACQATSAKGTYMGMKWSSGMVPLIDTSKVEHFDNFMKDADISGIAGLVVDNGQNFTSAFEGAKMATLPKLNTAKGKIFTNMFKNSTIGCMGGIDTTNALTTVGMFDGAHFTQPDAAAIADIVASKNQPWVNTKSCKLQILRIDEIQKSTADIPNIGGSGTSEGIYKVIVDPSTVNGSISKYHWNVDEHKFRIAAGQGTDTVTIARTSPHASVAMPISCTVTDGSGSSDSGSYTFYVTRNFTYKKLELPVVNGGITLSDFINSKAGASYTGEVELINNSTIPYIRTGDLSKYSKVVLRNNGEIQAYSRPDGRIDVPGSRAAVEVTSNIEIDNKGWIRACGGKGAYGVTGIDDTYLTDPIYLERAGTHSITAPAGAIGARVSLSGAGGGGGAHYNSSQDGGGYRGEILELRTVKVTAGKGYTYTIGRGGAAGIGTTSGVGYNQGKKGGDTSIFGLTAKGGAGGTASGYKGFGNIGYSGQLGTFRDGKQNKNAYGGQAGFGGHGGIGIPFDGADTPAKHGKRGSGGGSADGRRDQANPGNGGNGIIVIQWEIKRTGGAAGEGGQGQGYGVTPDMMQGKPGKPSTPPGGNHGTPGTKGGTWGQYGDHGLPPGKAVSGKSHITWTDGKKGNISGVIVENV